MLGSISKFTVDVPQDVTIVKVRHGTPWQPESLQGIHKITERIAKFICIFGTFRTSTVRAGIELQYCQWVAGPKNKVR